MSIVVAIVLLALVYGAFLTAVCMKEAPIICLPFFITILAICSILFLAIFPTINRAFISKQQKSTSVSEKYDQLTMTDEERAEKSRKQQTNGCKNKHQALQKYLESISFSEEEIRKVVSFQQELDSRNIKVDFCRMMKDVREKIVADTNCAIWYNFQILERSREVVLTMTISFENGSVVRKISKRF